MTTACLAPNGMNVYHGNAPATRLLVGTAKGVAVLERAPGQDWVHTGTMLEGSHISSMVMEPVSGGVFAGVHRGTVFYSPDLGKSWEPRGNGISINHVYSLVYAVEDGTPIIYAGTEPTNVFPCNAIPAKPGTSCRLLALTCRARTNGSSRCRRLIFRMPKTMAVDPRDPRVFYLGVEQAGLFRDGGVGRTWRELDLENSKSGSIDSLSRT